MRKLIIFCLLMYIGVSCKNAVDTSSAKTDSGTAKTMYAYTIKNPDNWEVGSSANTAVALATLKAFEDGKIDECLAGFADSVTWRVEMMDGKFSKDSMKAILTTGRQGFKSIKIEMNDFESVISKDKKDEWVTIWYKQIATNMAGKTDSIAVIDDAKIVKGKIAELNEYTRPLHPKK